MSSADEKRSQFTANLIPDPPDNIHISEQALTSVAPIATDLNKLVPEGMTVLFITPEDIKRHITAENYYNALPPQIQDHLYSKGMVSKVAGEVLAHPSIGYSTRYTIGKDAPRQNGIIGLVSIKTTKEQMASALSTTTIQESSYIPPEKFTNLPGTNAQWRSAMALHEIYHLHDTTPGKDPLPFEIRADQKMRDAMANKYPDVAEAFIGIRAIAAVQDVYWEGSREGEETHITSIGVKSSTDDQILPDAQGEDSPDLQRSALDELQKLLARETALSLYPDIADMPEDKLEKNGFQALQQDSTLFLTVGRKLYENREEIFKDKPMQEQFLWEFLKGTKYAPEYFGVTDPNEIFPPPSYYARPEQTQTPSSPAAPGGQ